MPSQKFGRHITDICMGAAKYDNQHGVGILLNKKWRERIIDIEHISERAITTMILVNQQRIKLMSVHFSQSGYADHHIEKLYRTIEKHASSRNKEHTNCERRLQCRIGTRIRC